MSWLKNVVLQYLPRPLLDVLKKYHYRRSIARSSLEDIPEHTILKSLIPAGAMVIDIGANVGVYTKAFAQLVGTSGHVHSFEPVPLTFGILSANVRRLALSNVTLHNVALSDDEGDLMMEIPQYADGGENYYEARITASDELSSLHRVHVRTAPLDVALSGVTQPIGFIKMDVEGHELKCAHGASATLKRWTPPLLIEFSTDPDTKGSDADVLIHWLCGLGYVPYWWNGAHLCKRSMGDRSVDYLFLQPRHVTCVDPALLVRSDPY